MNVHITETRLMDLAAGLLSSAEQRDVTGHVRSCAECENRLRLIVADRESARSGPAPALSDGKIQLARKKRRPAILVPAAIAAAVVLVVAVGILVVNHKDSVPDYWIPITGETVILRTVDDGMTDALRAYQAHDAKAAVEELRAFTPFSDDPAASTLRDVYLASALVNAGRSSESLELLERLTLNFLPGQWRGHARWVRYVALRRTDQDKEADEVLDALAAEPGEMGDKARAELQRLR